MRLGRQFCEPKTKFPSFLIKRRPNLFPNPRNPRPPRPPHPNVIFLHDAASQRFFHRHSEGHGAQRPYRTPLTPPRSMTTTTPVTPPCWMSISQPPSDDNDTATMGAHWYTEATLEIEDDEGFTTPYKPRY